MADLTNNLEGNQVPVHAEESRGTAAPVTGNNGGPKEGSPKGLASPQSRGDKIAKNLGANAGKSPTLSSKLAMADLTTNHQGNQEPFIAEETRTSKAHRTGHACEAKNGKNQASASPKPGRNKIANKVTTNKKMDDRVKNGKQLYNEGRGAVLARLEQKRTRGKPPPKRGDVKKAIVEAGVKKVIDTGKAFCCAPGSFDVDTFVGDLPFPTRSEPTATLWPKVKV